MVEAATTSSLNFARFLNSELTGLVYLGWVSYVPAAVALLHVQKVLAVIYG